LISVTCDETGSGVFLLQHFCLEVQVWYQLTTISVSQHIMSSSVKEI